MEFGDEESACTTWENSDVFSRFTDGNDDGNDEAPEEESDGNDGDTEGIGTEDHVLVYPRRKHGQERLGSERPPVVVTREYLESNYNIPLTVVAKNLNISATVLKQLCRRVGIAKWPYKRPKLALNHKLARQAKTENNIAASNSFPVQDQRSAMSWRSQQPRSSCPDQGATSCFPEEPKQAYPAQVAFQSSHPVQRAHMTVTHNTNNEAPQFSFPGALPANSHQNYPSTSHDSFGPQRQQDQFSPDDNLRFTPSCLEISRSPSPAFQSPFGREVQASNGCEFVDDFNPDALRLSAALWRGKPSGLQPELEAV
eukprot:3938363-Rhodomonas_salina.1